MLNHPCLFFFEVMIDVLYVTMIFESWNVRGLAKPCKRRMVKDGVLFAGLNLVGLQEFKLVNPSVRTLKSFWGGRLTKWLVLDAVDIAGVVLLGWNENQFDCIDSHIGIFSVSGVFKWRQGDLTFLFTTVYARLRKRIKLYFGGS